MLTPALPPGASREIGDARPEGVVPDDDEDPGLKVLGTRGMGAGTKAEPDQLVVHRSIGELPARTLPEHDVEERFGVRCIAWINHVDTLQSSDPSSDPFEGR